MRKGPVGRARSLPTTVQDAALAAGVVLADLLVFSANTFPRPAIGIYAVVAGLALVWRRRAPLLVFGVLWLHSLISLWVPGYAPVLGQLLALYTVAAQCSQKAARSALALAFTVLVLGGALDAFSDSGLGVRQFVGFLALFGLLTGSVWCTGRWAQVSRLHTAELEHRRQVEAREAVVAERTRIARELHDIVAHSVTVMMLQAAIAKRLMGDRPPEAAQALADVDDQGKQAMGELRRMLVALRADDAGADTGLGIERRRGLNDLGTLIAGVSRTGVSVDLETAGDPPRLDPSVDLTAYRVVQEALTNTTRHAGPGTHAVVRWTWSGNGDLLVQVSDDGHGRTEHATGGLSTGHGLLGLRERVAVVGGHLEAGPTPDGGFQVTATLPVAGHGATTSPPGETQLAAPASG
jgi:signal transduction histidine kinase